MNAYVYNADIYCEDCAEKIKSRLDNHTVKDNGDSENYPQGPYSQGGGEADTPRHCGDCGKFLENPLTSDGIDYVKDALSHMPANRLSEWAEFYKYALD